MTPERFNKTIADHYRRHGRHDMPWRKMRDPYRILVSEIMLQQTQVGRVTPFYENFIKKFPTFTKLAKANTRDVLRAWQGLGYNRRALALQKTARVVLEKFNGKLPRGREALESLPGIGPGTSGSLLAFAFNEPVIFIETNIRRVFIHFFFVGREMVTDLEIQRYIRRTIDEKHARRWYWALMDYGAWLTKTGKEREASENPNRRGANYVRQSEFKGSDRELRGKILRYLLARRKAGLATLARECREPQQKIRKIAGGLSRDGILAIKGGLYCINNI